MIPIKFLRLILWIAAGAALFDSMVYRFILDEYVPSTVKAVIFVIAIGFLLLSHVGERR